MQKCVTPFILKYLLGSKKYYLNKDAEGFDPEEYLMRTSQ